MKTQIGLLLLMLLIAVGCDDSISTEQAAKSITNMIGMTLNKIPQGAQTDLGLKYYLAALKTPAALHFPNWRVTDKGMVHLKNLTNLQRLNLNGTKITDEGLIHLKKLANLQTLFLSRTNITDAGVADLQMALPNCKILH